MVFVKKGAEIMLCSFEHALQIHHAKCEMLDVYQLDNPADAWAGFGVTAICPTDDFYSDDELVAFDSFDRTAYEEKISKGPSALPDKAFPVLVIVRAEREG